VGLILDLNLRNAKMHLGAVILKIFYLDDLGDKEFYFFKQLLFCANASFVILQKNHFKFLSFLINVSAYFLK